MAVVKLDGRGRILLTKDLRKALEIQGGDHLIVKSVDWDKIVLEKPARLQNKVAQEDTLD